MTFEIVNSLNYAHMIVKDADNTDYSSYGFRMICENRIDGLLESKLTYINNQSLMYYDIFSKVPLVSYAAEHPVDVGMLTAFIKKLCRLSEKLNDYLLGGECLLLNPENIYVDEKTGEFYFAAYPKDEGSFSTKLLKTAEFFLSRMPVKDHEGTAMGYKLYQSCINGNLSNKSLEDIVYMEIKKEEETSKAIFEEQIEDGNMEISEPDKKKKSFDINAWIKSFIEKIKGLFRKNKDSESLYEDDGVLADENISSDDNENYYYYKNENNDLKGNI